MEAVGHSTVSTVTAEVKNNLLTPHIYRRLSLSRAADFLIKNSRTGPVSRFVILREHSDY